MHTMTSPSIITACTSARFVCILLHDAVDLEPVRSAAIPAPRLGHAHHQALPEPAGLAGCPVLLVYCTPVIVLAFLKIEQLLNKFYDHLKKILTLK